MTNAKCQTVKRPPIWVPPSSGPDHVGAAWGCWWRRGHLTRQDYDAVGRVEVLEVDKRAAGLEVADESRPRRLSGVMGGLASGMGMSQATFTISPLTLSYRQ